MTSPSEQVYEMGQVGHLGTLNIEDWCTYGDGIAENILANQARQWVAWGPQETLLE